MSEACGDGVCVGAVVQDKVGIFGVQSCVFVFGLTVVLKDCVCD